MITLADMIGQVPVWFLGWGQHLVIMVFWFLFGACVGSFLNVVAHRVPEGRSVVRPGSRCPTCGWSLTWRENLPIIGLIMLLGRCRKGRTRISIQYPLIELLLGLVFAGSYLAFFAIPASSWWSQISSPWWTGSGIGHAWPAFVILLTLLSGLIVSTIIDARTFLIPAPITNFMTGIALLGWLIQGLLVPRPMVEGFWPIPTLSWPLVGLSVGAVLGLMLAGWCLRQRIIPRSFLDYEDYVEEGETLGEYPHARREMGKELLFLLPVLLGGILGALLVVWIGPETGVPRWLMAISASIFGALVGGGLVWGVRILGTLAFGREAMGMGDVHLLVAVGAALGWVDPIKAFFIAPFTALAWVFLSRILTVFSRKAGRELPYGPHLAFATVLVIFLRPAVDMVQHELFHPLP